MLTKIFIEKYRSCENIEITDFSNFLLFVGKNGVGKTNIFRAISWVAKQVRTGTIDDENLWDIGPSAVSLELILNGKTVVYSIKHVREVALKEKGHEIIRNIEESLKIVLQNGVDDPIFVRKNGEVIVGPEQYRLPIGEKSLASASIMALLPQHIVTPIVTEFFDFISKVSYNHLDTVADERCQRFVMRSDFLKWQKTSEVSLAMASATELRLLDMRLKNRDKFDELKTLLVHMGLVSSLSITEMAAGDDGHPQIYFFHWTPQYQENKESRAWNDLSFGTRRLIKLFVALFYQEDNVFMVEQPEDGIHPGLMNQVLPMLRAYVDSRQLFIATHSPEVLNAAAPHEIRIVDVMQGVTTVRPLDESEMEAACAYLREDGPLSNFISMIEE